VLSRVLSHAVEDSKLAGNPCEGIRRKYTADRSEIVWTDADIGQLKRSCSAEIAHAVDLAAHMACAEGPRNSIHCSEEGRRHRQSTLHDLRGTAAIWFYIAGLPIRAISEIRWSEDNVEKIIRRYVARGTATRAIIRQLKAKRLSKWRKLNQPHPPLDNARLLLGRRPSNGLTFFVERNGRDGEREPLYLHFMHCNMTVGCRILRLIGNRLGALTRSRENDGAATPRSR
jgi:hypothetical protein